MLRTVSKDLRIVCGVKILVRSVSQSRENPSSELDIGNGNHKSSPKNLTQSKDLYNLASRHPGRQDDRVIDLPALAVSAAEKILQGSLTKDLKKKSDQLAKYLHGRHPPVDDSVVKELAQKYEERFARSSLNTEYLSQEERHHFESEVVRKVLRKVKRRVYHWEPLKFTEDSGLVYLVTRFAPNYATLKRIFEEIRLRDGSFVPETILDFGSGLGSAFWAASDVWIDKPLKECVNIEASTVMSTLAARLLEKGLEGSKPENFKGISFRQNLPATHSTKFDMVVSAHSMFEVPSTKDRLKTALSLWEKTEKYLVLCELGTKAGHRVLMEIRSFLIDATKDMDSDQVCQVLAPCPHQFMCPRLEADDGTPCNFAVRYQSLGTSKMPSEERYTYMILHKGKLPESEDVGWPRLVRDTKIRSRHVICEVCTSQGTLQRLTFTKGKHSDSALYHIARKSKWGDRLPLELTQEEEEQLFEADEIPNLTND